MNSTTLTLSPLLGSGMVLQRNQEALFSGRDLPNQSVEVRFRGHRATTRAGHDGAWAVRLPSGEAGGPFEVIIAGSQTLRLTDVLVGEVWLASGQSNMQWRMDQCGGAKSDIAAADFPNLRYFTVGTVAHSEPMESVSGAWRRVTPDTVGFMSAVGFYFARHLWRQLNVPVGVVVSAWGGTPAEAWTSRDAFRRTEITRSILARFDEIKDRIDDLTKDAARIAYEWEVKNMPADPGIGQPDKGWARPDFDVRSWRSMSLPNTWQAEPDMNFNGVVWFRREVALPASWRGKDLELSLGVIDDFDDTFVNGERVGGMGKDVFQAYAKRRVYRISASLTRTDALTLAVRVFDHFGVGGFTGTRDQMYLRESASSETIPLDGPWQYEVEWRLPPPRPDLFSTYPAMPVGALPEQRPGHLFNSMIHPLRHWNWAGAIWYQGESNGGRSGEYADLFQALIEGWRAAFRQKLPFLFVQLPNFASGADWPLLREAQAAALALPDTGMAVTLDVGNVTDIHPQNKEPVGRRLALLALEMVYGIRQPCRSPEVRRIEFGATSARADFDHAYDGLKTSDGQSPRGFELAGPDGAFHPATARVDGASVVVEASGVKNPAGIRYAFHAAPEVNLVNSADLPAAPFRRDASVL